MPTRRKPIVLGALTATALLALAAALSLLSTPHCNDRILLELTSPDEQQVATVFIRNCGATTDFTTHVAVRPRGTDLGEDSKNLLMLEGRPAVGVEWKRANVLQIERPGNRPAILEQVVIWGRLDVIYVDCQEK